jgi:hypothetical protein
VGDRFNGGHRSLRPGTGAWTSGDGRCREDQGGEGGGEGQRRLRAQDRAVAGRHLAEARVFRPRRGRRGAIQPRAQASTEVRAELISH